MKLNSEDWNSRIKAISKLLSEKEETKLLIIKKKKGELSDPIHGTIFVTVDISILWYTGFFNFILSSAQ